MKTETVSFPTKLPNGDWGVIEVPYEEMLSRMKKNIDKMPEIVAALKKADHAGWQRLFDDITPYVDGKADFVHFVKIREKNGRQAVSIGEPNLIYAPMLFVMGAFSAGFLLGTACVSSGRCMFVD